MDYILCVFATWHYMKFYLREEVEWSYAWHPSQITSIIVWLKVLIETAPLSYLIYKP